MKIFFIIDEFAFFLPDFLDKTIQRIGKKYNTVGITALVTPKNKPTFSSYLISKWQRLGVKACFLLGIELFKLYFLSMLFELGITKNPSHIYQVAKKYNIPIFSTQNVNDSSYLSILESLKPDVIVSSCSQIFGKRLLSLPTIACINRHSGLLPSYGGLLPIFQAMIHDEKFTGVTVHTMVKEIDRGKILSQRKIPIKSNDTLFSLYKKSYEESIQATLDGLENISKKHPREIRSTSKPSYFSFPTSKDWDTFFKLKKRVI